MSEFPEAPKTDITSIENSEFKQEIFNMFLSGWSPASVQANLKRRGEKIPLRDLYEYHKQIPAGLALEPSELSKALKRIDVKVNTLQIMQEVIILFQKRLDEALLHSRVTGQQDAPVSDDKRAKDSLVEKRARLLFDYCRKYVLTLNETGQLLPPYIQLERVERVKIPATLREMLETEVVEVKPEQIEEPKDES